MVESQEIIEEMFNKGILVSKDLLSKVKEKELDISLLEKIDCEADLIVLNPDYIDIIVKPHHCLIDWYEIDCYRVDAEKGNDDLYQDQLKHIQKSTLSINTKQITSQQEISSLETTLDISKNTTHFSTETNALSSSVMENDDLLPNNLEAPSLVTSCSSTVTVVVSHKHIPHKYTVSDFTNFFISRYRFLENLLRNRQELQHTLAINRVLGKKERETVSVIGLIDEINETRNGNLIITIEDMTGKIKTFVSKNKKNLFKAAKDLVFDEVVGITGACGDKIIFVEDIVWPDIPPNHELKKGPSEDYVVFLSDIHVGSNLFMEKEFTKFLKWINGEVGDEVQKEIAAKVKYVIIAGDLVDGIGIYPSQKEELNILDIKEQYAKFTSLMKKVPLDKKIIICPGNHDVVHLAEPQSIFYEEFASSLFELPNITLVTNPALVNIGKTEQFSGFDILMYHGFSFDYYVANVESIRSNGGYHRSDLIMKFLLKRRHLAPSFKSTPYLPSHKEDPFLIKTIPDFLITGHIHYCSVGNYRGVTMISGSCWQGKTSFQEKLGHEPEPARVPVVNLKTREVRVLKFG